jgi:hypothetical protein
MPVEPVVSPVKPELPDTKPLVIVEVEPIHGVIVTAGAPVPINGLTPALNISVEPRGIVPPSSLVVPIVPGLDSGDAVPVDKTTPDGGDTQPLEGTIEPMPPPSNDVVPVAPVTPVAPVIPVVPVIPIVPDAAPPVTPEEEVVAMQPELLDVGPIGVGPKPPGLISVAPSGIPVGRPDEVVPGMPSGDVSPMLGMAVCAKPASQLKRTATAAMNNRRIQTSSVVPPKRPGKRPGRPCQVRQCRA